jgi:hypothetical protein
LNLTSKRADLTKDESFSSTVLLLEYYLHLLLVGTKVPTALGASRQRVSAIAVIAVVVAAATATGLVVATPAATAVAFFFAVLFGRPEELEGVSDRRVIAAGEGADLLFRGGIGSIPRESVVAVALRLLLEQEPEVLAISLGLIVLRDDAEVELLCILVQRASASCAAAGSYSSIGSRLSGMKSREETEELEEEGEEGEPMKLEPEEEEIDMAAVGLGVLRCLALGGR